MYIILAIIVEIISILVSLGIHVGGGVVDILRISRKGYKIDEKKLKEIQEEVKKPKKVSTLRSLLTGVLMFFPGINILWAIGKSIYTSSVLLKELKKSGALIPMTDAEKETYAGLTRLKDKFAFTLFNAIKYNEEEEFFMVLGGQILYTDPGLREIEQNRLDPNEFTYDEVMKLNEITGTTYRFGRVDNENTAFIGVPETDTEFKRVKFESEDGKIIHNYTSMTDEEAKDKSFIVYPYRTSDEVNQKLEEAVKEIENARLKKTKDECAVAVYENMNNDVEITKEETGPVLKKTIGRR
jgi:hypothetical protein